MTLYANIWIKGGSRPLFFRPMGERGSAHKPSVIQIFAYPGYKEAYMGGFILSGLRLVSSSGLFTSARLLDFSSGHLLSGAGLRRRSDSASFLRVGASTILPSDPEHQQFPSPIPR